MYNRNVMKVGVKLKLKRLGIRKQLLYLLLSCSLITLLVAGGIAFFGMIRIKSDALKIGVEIGKSAEENSSETLRETITASLQGLVHERANQVNYIFNDFVWDVTMLSKEMTTILQNPQNYSPRYTSEPDLAFTGKITPQIIYESNVSREELAYEVGLTGNLQDFMMRLNEGDDTIASTYVVSKNGFCIMTDTVANVRIVDGRPFTFNYKTRPWYQKAMSEQKLIFTDLFIDLALERGLAISCASPYYDANGEIAGVVGEGRTLKNISDIINKTKIGKTGFGFILNERGQVLFSPKTEGSFAVDYDNNLDNDPSLFDNKDQDLVQAVQRMTSGETGLNLVNIDGTSYYLAYTPLEKEGWSFGAVIEESEVTLPLQISNQLIEDSTYQFVGMLNNSIKLIMIAILLAFTLIIALIPFVGRKIADKFTKPLLTLSDGVREIASGNFDKKLDIQTGNEIEHLANCFNAMTDELQRYMKNLMKVTADKERIATELNVAANIQISMLPHNFDFNRDDFEIYAIMNAAKEVGGDFYDFYLLDEKHLVITMADVSGKGVPAALFMSRSKTILKNFATMMNNPDDFAAVMMLANNQLCQGNDEMMFVTVFMGMLDLDTGKFIYVNGGHNPPMVYHKSSDKFEYMQVKQNIVLGMMDDMDFEQQEMQLESGDILYLYTDGVTEAMDVENKQYGEERLSECLNKVNKKADLPTILKNVKDDLSKHVGEAEQSDDITMLAVKLKM